MRQRLSGNRIQSPWHLFLFSLTSQSKISDVTLPNGRRRNTATFEVIDIRLMEKIKSNNEILTLNPIIHYPLFIVHFQFSIN